jgi:uncharacterized protein with WD repeat
MIFMCQKHLNFYISLCTLDEEYLPEVAELWLILFARYLVTYSPHADDHPSDMKRLIIWDIRTGIEKRNFSSDGPAIWPIFRWSQDDRFFARIGTDVLSVYETPVRILRCIACTESHAVSIHNMHLYIFVQIH